MRLPETLRLLRSRIAVDVVAASFSWIRFHREAARQTRLHGFFGNATERQLTATMELEPSRIAATIWRHKLFVCLVTILGALAAFGVAEARHKTFAATATVLLDPTVQITQLPSAAPQQAPAQLRDPDRYVRDQIVTMTSQPVLQAAAQADKVTEPWLNAQVSASQDQVTDVLDVTASGGHSAARAARAANAVANAYAAYMTQVKRSGYTQQAARIGQEISSLSSLLTKLNGAPGQPNAATSLPATQAIARATQRQIAVLSGDEQTLLATGSLQSGGATVLQPAVPAAAVSTPRVVRSVALGGVGAALASVIALLIWALFDDRVHSERDLENVLGPVVGVLDYRRRHPDPTRRTQCYAIAARLRALARKTDQPLTVIVTEATDAAGDASHAVASELAAALIGAGLRVTVSGTGDHAPPEAPFAIHQPKSITSPTATAVTANDHEADAESQVQVFAAPETANVVLPRPSAADDAARRLDEALIVVCAYEEAAALALASHGEIQVLLVVTLGQAKGADLVRAAQPFAALDPDNLGIVAVRARKQISIAEH